MTMYEDGYIDILDDDHLRLTPKGVHLVASMYTMGLNGATIEQIEEEFNLDSGLEGTEEHHLEYKILMAMGDLSGLLDQYDEMAEMSDMLDEIETEFLYGDED